MNPLQKYMFLQMQSGQQMNPALVAHLAKGGQPSGAPKELHRGGGQVMMPDMPFMQGHPALATPAMNDFMQGQGISPEGSSLEGGMPPEGEMGMPGGEYMDGASKAQAMAMNVPEQSQGPLEEGANRGREAAMQSLAMNDQQKQQSMGHAIMAMMSNMAKSQNPTMLGSLNESFGPASEAYQRAQAGHESMNQKHYEMQRAQERDRIADVRAEQQAQKFGVQEARRQQEHEDKMAVRREEVENKKQMASEKAKSAGYNYTSQGVEEGKLQDNFVDKRDLTTNERGNESKRMNEDLKIAHSMEQADKAAEDIEKIIKENPGFNEGFKAVLQKPEDYANPSALSKLKGMFLSEKEKAVMQRFAKAANALVLAGGNAMGSKAFTDAKAKLIESTKPMIGMTKEANQAVIKGIRDEFKPWKDYKKDIVKAQKAGAVVYQDLDRYRAKEAEKGGAPGASQEDLSGLSDEDLDKLLGGE